MILLVLGALDCISVHPKLIYSSDYFFILPSFSSPCSGKGSIPSLDSPQSLDGCYFSPTLVTDWFWGVVSEAVEELRRSPQRGIPTPERLERNGPLTTIILQVQTRAVATYLKRKQESILGNNLLFLLLFFLQAGSSRVLYDLLPVVSFRGWPAVAQGWLTANHFWDGKITEEEAISGFYLLPCCSPLGGRPDREWRLAFSRSEVRGLLIQLLFWRRVFNIIPVE